MPHIYLTGFMGAGKTTVGKLLAESFRVPYLDCDQLIVERSGKSINAIFADEGEQAFRAMETELLNALLEAQPAVISTGGGMPVREENRQLMRKGGIIIHLHAAPETIYERVKEDTERPLLKVADPLGRIQELLAGREAAYADCDLSLPTDDLSPAEIARALAAYLREQNFRP